MAQVVTGILPMGMLGRTVVQVSVAPLPLTLVVAGAEARTPQAGRVVLGAVRVAVSLPVPGPVRVVRVLTAAAVVALAEAEAAVKAALAAPVVLPAGAALAGPVAMVVLVVLTITPRGVA